MRIQTVFRNALLAASMLSVVTAGAYAQVPGSADSSRVRKHIEEQMETQQPRVSPNIEVKQNEIRSAPAGAEKLQFNLSRLVIDGMTVYSDEDIKPLYADMLGQQISLADVYGIAERLTVKYRNDGYILTQVVVPAQTIQGGVARLQVVEGFVDDISIEGEPRSGVEKIRKYAQKVRASQPLNAKVLERYLLLINDIPGISARSILQPSKKTPGAADLIFVVEDDLYQGNIQADNRGSRFLGPLQVLFGNRFNSLFKRNEAIGLQVVTAPEDHEKRELDYVGASYAEIVNDEGGVAKVEGSLAITNPGHGLTAFDITGRSEILTASYTHPVIRTRATNLDLTGQFDVIDISRTDNTATPVEDRLRVFRAGSDFEFADRLLGVNSVSAQVSKGVNTFGAGDNGVVGKSRALGESDFTKATAELSRLQHVANHLELFVSATGQIASDHLLSSEEFGVGGVSYGSAYDSSEIVGDEGIAGRIELRLSNPVPVDYISSYQFYGFYDGGRVWDPDATAANLRKETITSAGVGARVDITPTFFGSVELAFPLNHDVQSEGDNDPRFFVTLSKDL